MIEPPVARCLGGEQGQGQQKNTEFLQTNYAMIELPGARCLGEERGIETKHIYRFLSNE